MDKIMAAAGSVATDPKTSRLSQLEDGIRKDLALFADLGRQAVETAWRLGGYFIAVKQNQLNHGEWLPWLECMGIEPTYAQDRMCLRRKFKRREIPAFDSIDAALNAITSKPYNARSTYTGGDDACEWYTPPEIVEAARRTMGSSWRVRPGRRTTPAGRVRFFPSDTCLSGGRRVPSRRVRLRVLVA